MLTFIPVEELIWGRYSSPTSASYLYISCVGEAASPNEYSINRLVTYDQKDRTAIRGEVKSFERIDVKNSFELSFKWRYNF